MDMSTPLRASRAARSKAAETPARREPGDSPWLGEGIPPSPSFLHYQELERSLAAMVSAPAGAIAPATLFGAFADWAVHLAGSPAKQWELAQFAGEQWQKLWAMAIGGVGRAPADWCVEPMPQDRRFRDPRWHRAPFTLLAQSFLLQQAWWQRATTDVPGMTRHHEEMVSFAARQWLDMLAPSNFVTLNPEVRERTAREFGANLLRGTLHTIEDNWRDALDQPPVGAEQFQVGVNLAVTPGHVVFRNPLIELIQYAPTTAKVHPEPVLLVPAWIMKYYILDLSPHNSLVKYLVDRGFTVFAISWKNPDGDDRDLGLDDYYRLGVRDALDAIGTIVPAARTHALGYCLGGTLLSIAASALGREGSKALASMTLLAAQTDFTEPGELSLFVDESQVNYLENQMWRRGYLDKHNMKATFRMMRSADLIWSYRLGTHLLGERQPVTDLMAWNADGTRMPYRMHSQYLRQLFLENALARGEFRLEGVPINLHDIAVPAFIVGTLQDHVAPWRSVFTLNHLTDTDQTYVLASGGHNVGVVNPPGQPRARYRLRGWSRKDRRFTPDEWLEATPEVAGSWWEPWVEWLTHRSSPPKAPPPMGAPEHGLPLLEPAPGTYVHLK